MTASASLARPVRIEGRGIFSGARCLCTLRPWEDGLPAPLTFKLGAALIPALPQNFGRQPNCTTFVNPDGIGVSVTEHLFAALWAAGIDHALIELTRPELPNHDGSAITLYEELLPGGRSELGERRALALADPLRVEAADGAYIEVQGAGRAALRANGGQGQPPSQGLHISYTFSHPQLGEQHLALDVTRESALRDILPARTFATVEEAEALIAAGLLCNRHTEDAVLLSPPHSAAGDQTYRPSTPLRFADEFARHKVLDLLGDVYCTGVEINGRITAVRSGHGLNRALAVQLAALG